MAGIAAEHEAGEKTTALCRQHGIRGQTCKRWKQEYGVHVAKRLKEFEETVRLSSGWSTTTPERALQASQTWSAMVTSPVPGGSANDVGHRWESVRRTARTTRPVFPIQNQVHRSG